MPESFTSPLHDRCSALESFVGNVTGTQLHGHWNGHLRIPSSIHHNGYGRSQSAIIADGDRLRAAIYTPKAQDVDPPSPTSDTDGHVITKPRGIKRARVKSEGRSEKPQRQGVPPPRKGSSVHFGVRYRPDLSKYVAEIRVAEWKEVDKKVWLGTFDAEEGAARGVDVARKLLNCRKKRPPNLPCPELDLYATRIPPQLNLTDLTNETMFKDVVAFIKNEAQLYAARFPLPTTTSTTTIPPVAAATPTPQPQYYSSSPSSSSTTILLPSDEADDVLWKDVDELNLSDSELSLPAPRSDHHINIDHHHHGLIDLDEAFALDELYSTSPELDQFQYQYQFVENVVDQITREDQSSPEQVQAWEMEMAMEMAMEMDPVCHNLAAAACLSPTWPGTATPSDLDAGPVPSEQSLPVLYGGGGTTYNWTPLREHVPVPNWSVSLPYPG